MRATLALLVAALGAFIGSAWTASTPVFASRNSGGTYSLPAGNPVVTGTTITTTWANTTLADLGTEITNSLDRGGRGAMTAPLQLAAGSVSAPGLTFSSDTDLGLYRSAANTMRVSAGNTYAMEWSSSAVTVPIALATSIGVTATQSTSNGHAITATGNGTGRGVFGTGGASAGVGVYGAGGTGGIGVWGQGQGAGGGVVGASTSGAGGAFSSDSGYGAVVQGNTTSAPLRFIPQAAPSGASNGDVYYDSGTNKLRVRAAGAWVDLH